MTESQPSAMMRYAGFDAGGDVFLYRGRILRGIQPGGEALYREILRNCEKHDLFRFGIVATCESDISLKPDLSYDLVLEHEKIPFISYPHEWPTSMLKVAALFHVDLYSELSPYGLTIKDWHPYNILFKDTKPVFVDFASIIPVENLKDEAYLTPPRVPSLFKHLWDSHSAYFYEMHQRMCVPYFLLPLYLMHQGRYKETRRRMFETTLNAGRSVIKKREVFPEINRARLLYDIRMILKRMALLERGEIKERFLQILREEISSLDVSVTRSDYTYYYEAKKEDFPFEPSERWNKKQRVVYEAIGRLRPETVLDVSCNTGWFSILAAKLGCKVMAFDIDEACMNVLYEHAEREKLSILPLVMDLAHLTPDVFPRERACRSKKSCLWGDFPLLLSAVKRFKCDLVLALAIVHHMVLGAGHSFAEVVGTLSALAKKYMVIEYVAKEDDLIAREMSFFPSYKASPHSFDWYNLTNFVRELGRYFTKVEIEESYSESRFIAICEK
jgi:SAM-dependent methyltransferase